MKRRGMLLLCALLALSAGCGSSGDDSGVDDDSTISRSDMGEEWPLTVDSGRLGCDGSNGIGEATITVNGTTYALNGLAKSNDSNQDIRPIWADDPDVAGLKQDIGPLIDRALKLCK